MLCESLTTDQERDWSLKPQEKYSLGFAIRVLIQGCIWRGMLGEGMQARPRRGRTCIFLLSPFYLPSYHLAHCLFGLPLLHRLDVLACPCEEVHQHGHDFFHHNRSLLQRMESL